MSWPCSVSFPKTDECHGIGWPRDPIVVPSLSLNCSFVKSRVPNDSRSIVVGGRLCEQPVVVLFTVAGWLRIVCALSKFDKQRSFCGCAVSFCKVVWLASCLSINDAISVVRVTHDKGGRRDSDALITLEYCEYGNPC